MNAAKERNSSSGPEVIVLYGPPGTMHERILELIGFDAEFGVFSKVPFHKVMHGVSWDDYQRFLKALADFCLRHTYSEGSLEVMTSERDEQWAAAVLSRMIETMAYTLDIAILSAGSTTLTNANAESGIEPDESYHVSVTEGERTYVTDSDQPPNLVVDLGLRTTSIDRLRVLGKLHVPEVWSYNGQDVSFQRPDWRWDYEPAERSRAFPFLAAADVSRFLAQRHETDENSVVRAFVEWAKEAFRRKQAGSET